MENYNLTAELKKIASGITTSDPNTELGNINSGVGNLDAAMQGVATAIGNISIPDTRTSLGSIATAIGTKAIPDPNANIQAVSTAISALSGGKSLVDIDTILSSINNTLAQIGLNNVVNLTPTAGGFIMTYGGGGQTNVPNLAQFVDYTDTNNIGATNVQGAVDKITAYSEGTATLNTAYLSGTVNWQKLGRVVSVFLDVGTVANLPSSNWDVALISGLPPVLCPMSWIRRWTLPAIDKTKAPIILAMSSNPGVDRTKIYSWGNGAVTSGISYSASITYITE